MTSNHITAAMPLNGGVAFVTCYAYEWPMSTVPLSRGWRTPLEYHYTPKSTPIIIIIIIIIVVVVVVVVSAVIIKTP
jgi:hypothetical protein